VAATLTISPAFRDAKQWFPRVAEPSGPDNFGRHQVFNVADVTLRDNRNQQGRIFSFTPKALANSSPGLERKRQPWVKYRIPHQPCKGSMIGEPLQGSNLFLFAFPGLSLCSNPGLELVNAFGVKVEGLKSPQPPTCTIGR